MYFLTSTDKATPSPRTTATPCEPPCRDTPRPTTVSAPRCPPAPGGSEQPLAPLPVGRAPGKLLHGSDLGVGLGEMYPNPATFRFLFPLSFFSLLFYLFIITILSLFFLSSFSSFIFFSLFLSFSFPSLLPSYFPSYFPSFFPSSLPFFFFLTPTFPLSCSMSSSFSFICYTFSFLFLSSPSLSLRHFPLYLGEQAFRTVFSFCTSN